MRKSVTQEVSNFQDKEEEVVHVVHIPIETLEKKMVKAKQGKTEMNIIQKWKLEQCGGQNFLCKDTYVEYVQNDKIWGQSSLVIVYLNPH